MDLRTLVTERYDQLEKCYGHCEEPATSKFLNSEADPVITGYSCHAAYLSRIIIYSESLSLDDSVRMITDLLGGLYEVKEDDVRIASRYAWDLGSPSSEDASRLMTVAYWTQNYRRTKSEDPHRAAMFLCEKCSAIFQQRASDTHVLCADCTSALKAS